MSEVLFKKGQFVRERTSPDTFAIFEGNLVESTTTYRKQYSLLLYYNPKHYCKMREGVWDYKETLVYKNGPEKCEKTTDTLKEDNWWIALSEEEIEKAMTKLLEKGFIWDEENATLYDKEGTEVCHVKLPPKPEYHGEKVMLSRAKVTTKMLVVEEPSTTPVPCTAYPQGHGYMGRWDEYEEWGEY